MGLLNEVEQQDMALVHRHIFQAVCDEKDCGRLIPAGAMYVVVKYTKQKWEGPGQKPFTWTRRIPKKVRCMDCENSLMAEVYEKYEKKKRVKLGKKNRKRVSPEEMAKIDPLIKKLSIRLLTKSEDPIPTDIFKSKLLSRIRKENPKFKKSEINSSLRYLRKAKVLICKKKMWELPEEEA